jgi:transcriptional regulator with XRE-family HTH domain
MSIDTFEQRLRWAMARKGISKAALAEAIGTSREALGKYFKGGFPQEQRWPKLAAVLGVTVAWLRDGEGSPDLPAPAGGDPAVADARTERLLAAVVNAASAGEYGLAASGADLLAQAYRELEARLKGLSDENNGPRKLGENH